MLRKSVQRKRRCALKTNMFGGGVQVAVGSPIQSSNGVPYPTNAQYGDCYTQARPGALTMQANVDLAQTPMAGGADASFVYTQASRKPRKTRKMRGGCGCLLKGGGQCPYKAVGGQCGAPKVGGKRKTRGGNRGFSIDVAQSVGGDGPNVAPVNTGIPCDARAGANNPNTVGPLPADPRAYGVGYSATTNTSTQPQKGGSEPLIYSDTMMGGGGYGGNGFDPACYRAPGSQMPVYPATSTGFHFVPSIQAGAVLQPGVVPFNQVVQYAARLGGARKTYRKKARKARKSRNRKQSRK